MFKRLFMIAVAGLVLPTSAAWAGHSWGPYHWARMTNTFDVVVINSTTSDWDGFVAQAVFDWSDSTVVDMEEDTNGSTSKKTRRQCKAPQGMIRICNLAYGFNGWLGIAGISLDSNGHIVKGYTKLNDSYFSSSYYNHDDWKQSVTCQELGHDLGLGHQDENFNNSSDSCMDYDDPPNEWPDWHDYAQLESIYADLDSYTTVAGSDSGGEEGGGGGGCNAPPGKGCNKSGLPQSNRDIGWGVSLGRRGHSETFMRIDADGTRHITHVLWVDEDHDH